MLPLLIEKFPPIVQLAEGVTPVVFAMVILVSVFGTPVTVIAAVPPKIMVPVLVKLVPFSCMVCAAVGAKFNVPLLLTVPLFVKEPFIKCV